MAAQKTGNTVWYDLSNDRPMRSVEVPDLSPNIFETAEQPEHVTRIVHLRKRTIRAIGVNAYPLLFGQFLLLQYDFTVRCQLPFFKSCDPGDQGWSKGRIEQ